MSAVNEGWSIIELLLRGARQTSSREPIKMKKLLIVDDSAILRMHLKGALQQYGLEVVGEATNGVEALEKFKETGPNLVTMDITMPEMNGLSCTREMLKISPDVKIVVISALSSSDIAIEAVAAGARDYLRKPFEPAELERCIRALLPEPESAGENAH